MGTGKLRRLLTCAAFVLCGLCCPAEVAGQAVCDSRDATAAEALKNSDVVFLGRAEKHLDQDPEGLDRGTPSVLTDQGWVSVRMFESVTRFKVIRSFKGVEGDSVLVGSGPEHFQFSFEEGEIYLVYAYRMKSGAYAGVDTCTRTRPHALAGADLEYLRRSAAERPETRLTGSVARQIGDYDSPARPWPDIKVTAFGGGTTKVTTTDASGVYRFVGIPPGAYEVRFDVPTPPGGLAPAERVAVAQGEWIGADYLAESEPKIVGFVKGPDGKSFAGARVRAVLVEEARAGDFQSSDDGSTDAEGRVVLPDLDAGQYVLVANPSGTLTPETPFHRQFYPGTLDLTKATVIAVETGKETRLGSFTIRRLLELSTLRGTVVDDQGKPLANMPVEIEQLPPEDAERSQYRSKGDWQEGETTDDGGRFSIKILVGGQYEVTVKDFWPGTTVYADPVKVTGRKGETSVRIVARSPESTRIETVTVQVAISNAKPSDLFGFTRPILRSARFLGKPR